MMRHFLLCTLVLGSLAVAVSTVEAGHRFWGWRVAPKTHQHDLSGVPYDDQTKTFICMSRPIPPNWVIVGIRHSVNCNGWGANSWIIQRLPTYPGAQMVICSHQPIPKGWAVVGNEPSCYCGHGRYGIRIQKL